MLRELTIENVAVIEKAVVQFDNGFNVLTGETGAGKSILIDSINAILGNRISKDIVRNLAPKAKIWAVFCDIPKAVWNKLDEDGYGGEDELLIYREISSDGKGSCRINGKPAAAAYLREICEPLITIHGQHDNQTLLNPAKHLSILDAYAKNKALYEAYYREYHALAGVEKELKSLLTDESEKQAKIDLLRYQVNEIEQAQLRPGEEAELLAKRNKLQNSQKIVAALETAYRALEGDEDAEAEGAIELLSTACEETEAIGGVFPEAVPDSEKMRDAFYSLQEVSQNLKNGLDAFAMDPESRESLEERLDLFYHLKQKYGTTAQEIIDFGIKAKADLEKIEFADEYMEKLYDKKEALLQTTLAAADALTESRLKAFHELQQKLQDSLAFLNMAGVQFFLQHKTGTLTSQGQDTMELYIVTNKGEQPKPLAKIASGGELSRIMLALKNALADSDELGTVIYDEIDTGVSGMAAGRIGRVLQQTATRGRQIICVTHTAQIAACADHHLLIQKQTQQDRTYTSITPLEANGRVEELARIISGNYITELSRANAAEMLKLSAREAKST